MKATDLLVGDSIYRADCYDRVVEIRSNGIIGADANRGLIPFDEIRPIEITPKILEKNGFEKVNESVFGIYNYSANLHIGIYFDEFRDNMPIIYLLDNNTGSWPGYQQYDLFDCKYVHELQHALHLCGIEKEIML